MQVTSGSRSSHGEGNDNLLQYSCLENTMGRRALWANSPWGRKRVEHDLMTKQQQMLAGTFNPSAQHAPPMNSGTCMSLKSLSGSSQAPFNPGGQTRINHRKFTKVLPPESSSCTTGPMTPPSPSPSFDFALITEVFLQTLLMGFSPGR